MKQFQVFYLPILILIFLTTNTEANYYAKKGCQDVCGGITIPYPFGIGSNCSVNTWYVIDCKQSKPYLSANNLEVLDIDLQAQTITVVRNTSQLLNLDLDGTPFLFSKDNIFVVEGCGNAVIMSNGSMIAGCSTYCPNDTLTDDGYLFGFNWCQTDIGYYFKTYSVDVTRLGSLGGDGSPGSAFLVDKNVYLHNYSGPPARPSDEISILWTLTEGELNKEARCWESEGGRQVLYLNDGSSVVSRKCYCVEGREGNPYLQYQCKEAINYAKKGCQDVCGEVTIPYPFGIGTNCSVNEWYVIDCKSRPYLSAFNNLEVLNIGLQAQTITVLRNTSQVQSLDLDGTPFLFSTDNIFVVEGCGNAVITSNGLMIAGCSTYCPNDTLTNQDYGFGFNHCETHTRRHFKSYSVDVTRLGSLDGDGSRPGSAFLVGPLSRASNHEISLIWTLTEDEFNKEAPCWESAPASESGAKVLYLDDGTSVVFRKCYCGEGREGNPYLQYQCGAKACSVCEASGLVCTYEEIELDERIHTSLHCVHPETYNSQDFGSNKSPMDVILGVSICMGLLFLTKFIYELHKQIKRTIVKKQKEKFFSRNGGLLLKKQAATDVGLADKNLLFTSRELEVATNHFNENRILGRGGQGTVYKGMLANGRIVAVKQSKTVNESQLEQFINEVAILSQVNHRNVVKLLGCCLETEVPILVSEFISNGTLYDLIQNNTSEFPFSLEMRLRIATQVAGALAYLHSATSIPIYHRDIKTTNILMDENFIAKVSDFGTSRLVSVDQTHLM